MQTKYSFFLAPWIIAICLLAGCRTTASAQWGPYHFLRDLEGTEAGWQQLSLPDGIFRHLDPSLRDLRIKGITAAGDTIEAPYLIRWPNPVVKVERSDFRLLNQSRQGNTYFATLTKDDDKAINRIDLEFDNTDFNWRIDLEGSPDGREWFSLLQGYRILAYEGPLGDYAFTTLQFPESDYSHYRIQISSSETVKLRAATYHLFQKPDIDYQEYTIISQSATVNKEQKQTELEWELATPVPVSRIELPVTDTFDYYRPLRIQLLTDSTRSESGVQYRYTEVYRGVLSSLEPPVFTFPPERTYRIRVIIDHQDNAPLKFGSPRVEGIHPAVIFRITEPADYHLVYGWPDAIAPRYDLNRFEEKIPSDVPEVRLAPEVRLRPDLAVRSPLLVNRAWLWIVLVLAIGVLGWFSMRMISKG
ncbi:DUF3999 family protein [Flavilitoribacter nigricans]|uniref:DUF3999 domain-containing protein n=1 Tax=Flavilitoribacter nigricans (strain ATCC 23147 / DSM 23189 / NBRC 102662 / NCIMB 1420 / SS-2) TaxID=1122177 RepID=A0A2D0NBJ6_FLAN2|nr:DUF3999 family protein [Flavilitoribacter nigricans]PHN05758.1 hypothetical protein CRP01_14885 [Flavilitoribacter nigricans DSM 23189 = NBRC 102662]